MTAGTGAGHSAPICLPANHCQSIAPMQHLPFDNSYTRLPERFFARVQPDCPPAPSLIRLNRDLAKQIGLDSSWLQSDAGIAMLSGKDLPDEADSIAMAYAGHQFGGWVPQLGDGRALLLGEVVGPDGVRRDIQLKGSGRTPFSRMGDGKAPLGPVLREYIVSEAMAALGVPTSRSLAAVATGEPVRRETILPGAVLTRVATSHVRVGTFQYFHARNDLDGIKALADYVIERHFPEFDPGADQQPYHDLLSSVIKRQATLIARWMGLGFIHGVMNTDNMQIAGETIDYGPCAFMEAFHPGTVFSSIDFKGRYSWINQPAIGEWNLARFAETLLPFLDPLSQDSAVAQAQEALAHFGTAFSAELTDVFAQKFGLIGDPNEAERQSFIDSTFKLLADQKVDFTCFFTGLTRIADELTQDGKSSPSAAPESFRSLFAEATSADEWVGGWATAFNSESIRVPAVERVAAMRKANPVLIPRNHRVEEAIRHAMEGDFAAFHRLVDALKSPCEERDEYADLESPAQGDEVVCQTFCGT